MIPPTIRYAIAFPSAGARGKSIGECWHPASSADGYHTVIVRADVADPTDVLAVLVHEDLHTALPPGTGHGKEFRKPAVALGLVGPMRSTKAGPALTERLNVIAAAIGPLPHAKLHFGHGADDRPKKQDGRMLKAACPCGYTIRLSRLWALAGLPLCPLGDAHGELVCAAIEQEEV